MVGALALTGTREIVTVTGTHFMKLSIVMPVYNEQGTLREVVARVLAVPLEIELICVDDASRVSKVTLLIDHGYIEPTVIRMKTSRPDDRTDLATT